jgi:inhibitor of KinA
VQGVVEAVASYDTVGVFFEGEQPSTSSLMDALSDGSVGIEARRHLVPVCYELGEDLAEAAQRLGLTEEQVVNLHCSKPYTCFAIGFCPGFPYLGTLPEGIRGLPRKAVPRVVVEPGSVAITGEQTGIYPLPRPGGWWILGRTPLTLVDVADRYFPIRSGDTVGFRPIGLREFEKLKGHRL